MGPYRTGARAAETRAEADGAALDLRGTFAVVWGLSSARLGVAFAQHEQPGFEPALALVLVVLLPVLAVRRAVRERALR